MIKFLTSKFMTISIIILLQQNLVCSKCSCENQVEDSYHKVSEALKYKLIAMATVLVSSLIGVCIPIFAKNCTYLNPENDFYFLIKAFAAGVILATGFIHILPDAFEALTSPCIGKKPWKMFPFSGFVTMVSAIGTLIMEALIMGYQKRSEMEKAQPLDEDDETHEANGSSHVHSLSLASDKLDSTNRLRYIIVSQVTNLSDYLFSIIYLSIKCVLMRG
jgi:zinc transporter 1/2/3